MKKSFILLILLFVSVGCQQATDRVLDDIRKTQKIIVVTRNAPTTYYNIHDEFTGPEYDMTQAFADTLGVKVEYLVKESTAEILSALKNGEAHIAAAGLTKTESREEEFLPGPKYQQVQQQVVCRRGGKSPKNQNDLAGLNIEVSSDTSYVDKLAQLREKIPQLKWVTNGESDTEALLEKVWLKKIDCTIADSNIADINRRYYPELKVRFSLTNPEPIAWMMPPDAHALVAEVEHWFEEYREQGQLKQLMDRYYGFIDAFDYVDTRKFVTRIYKVLPKYRKHFEQAAKKYSMDWSMLAAQAYQESHWRANARSPTGVRGMMMLTRTTADELGIKNRLDPVKSIMGGARYLNDLYKRIPDEVTEPDRTWFALAAYNVGMGHLWDARSLAEQMGKDPNRWSDLADVFPLLSRKKYYKKLKYGYARGSEPVSYVQRIRDYHNILHQKLGL